VLLICCVPKLLFYTHLRLQRGSARGVKKLCSRCTAVRMSTKNSPKNKIIYCRNYLFLGFSTLCKNVILNLVIFHVKPFSCSPPGLVIVLSAHWVGCIFYFLARLRHFDDSTWLAVCNHQNVLVQYVCIWNCALTICWLKYTFSHKCSGIWNYRSAVWHFNKFCGLRICSLPLQGV